MGGVAREPPRAFSTGRRLSSWRVARHWRCGDDRRRMSACLSESKFMRLLIFAALLCVATLTVRVGDAVAAGCDSIAGELRDCPRLPAVTVGRDLRVEVVTRERTVTLRPRGDEEPPCPDGKCVCKEVVQHFDFKGPVPGFRAWLDPLLASGALPLISAAESQRLRDALATGDARMDETHREFTDKLNESYKPIAQTVSTVDCPRNSTAKAGDTIVCTADLDGNKVRVQAKFTDDNGNVDFSTDSGDH